MTTHMTTHQYRASRVPSRCSICGEASAHPVHGGVPVTTTPTQEPTMTRTTVSWTAPSQLMKTGDLVQLHPHGDPENGPCADDLVQHLDTYRVVQVDTHPANPSWATGALLQGMTDGREYLLGTGGYSRSSGDHLGPMGAVKKIVLQHRPTSAYTQDVTHLRRLLDDTTDEVGRALNEQARQLAEQLERYAALRLVADALRVMGFDLVPAGEPLPTEHGWMQLHEDQGQEYMGIRVLVESTTEQLLLQDRLMQLRLVDGDELTEHGRPTEHTTCNVRGDDVTFQVVTSR